MGLPKGSTLGNYFFYVFEDGVPSRYISVFKCTPYNLRSKVMSIAKSAVSYGIIFGSDWSLPLVVTDDFKRIVFGPVSSGFDFAEGKF